jgi:hypothetical protein
VIIHAESVITPVHSPCREEGRPRVKPMARLALAIAVAELAMREGEAPVHMKPF